MKKVILSVKNEGIRYKLFHGLMKDFKDDIISGKKMIFIDDDKREVTINGNVEGIFGLGLDWKKRYIERGIWQSLAKIGVTVRMEDEETKEVKVFKA